MEQKYAEQEELSLQFNDKFSYRTYKGVQGHGGSQYGGKSSSSAAAIRTFSRAYSVKGDTDDMIVHQQLHIYSRLAARH